MRTQRLPKGTREQTQAVLAAADLAEMTQVFAGGRLGTAEVCGRAWSAQTAAERAAALDAAAVALRAAGFAVSVIQLAGLTERLEVRR